ncbi:MAG TPA: NAD+ synthase [Planctomycetota bacterium]|nr:NAD+ synthase [Planctomycetota bacterium]
MKIAAAQINPTIGDFDGNVDRILTFISRAREMEAQLVVFPEMSLTGYPPRDLLERSWFVEKNLDALNNLAAKVKDVGVIVGFVDKNTSEGKPLYNAAALIENGEIAYVSYKSLLPTYDVFDEDRYFEPAAGTAPVKFGGTKLAITICEDLWTDDVCGPRQLYHRDPLADVAKKKIGLIVNIAASPWWLGKEKLRFELCKNKALEHKLPVLMVNQVGGNDELVFDGSSVCVNEKGEIIARAKSFDEDLMMVDLQHGAGDSHGNEGSDPDMIYRALVLGTRDYAHKCGFQKAVIGLSGGLDSAVVACVAAEALGPENVLGVTMPTEFSSHGSVHDSETLARSLGIQMNNVSIQGLYKSYLGEFEKLFSGKPKDTTEENLQARIRGNVLMAISNKLGHLVLSTGNKSEIATGYTTLYGDMCGGLAAISDVPKTMINRIAREVINKDREVIPNAILTKPPSAELRANQKDTDTLPEYEVLDPILQGFIVDRKSPEEIVAGGADRAMVERVIQLVERAEYKRRQAAPGIKVTTKAFGLGRRFPIARKI